MRLYNWKRFLERNTPVGQQGTGGPSGGGTSNVMPEGPNYGNQKLGNTISSNHTDVIFSEIDNKIYTYDDYQQLYSDYLKSGGKPLHGFTEENLSIILSQM